MVLPEQRHVLGWIYSKWFNLRLAIFNLVGPLVSSGAWDDYHQYVLERGKPGKAAAKEQKTHFVEVAFCHWFSSQTHMGW